jgi:hypothetical protein
MEKEEIIDAVRDYLDADDWHYEYDAERNVIRAGVELKCKLKNARMIIRFRKTDYNVYMISPVSADAENLGEVLRFAAMANYGLASGNFEVDVEDGEIRYKSYVDCDGLEKLPKELFDDGINACWAMMDRYGNGFAALAMGFSDADTEIKKAEGDEE